MSRLDLKTKLFASIVILCASLIFCSIYFNAAFADLHGRYDIAERQKIAEQKATSKYMSYYQFANMDQSKRNWSGLTSIETDETSRGRNIQAQEQVSLQNAISQFDTIHIKQLANLAADGYKGISSTPTNTQGRDRNTMIENARAISIVNANDILSQLSEIQQTYANFSPSTPTDTFSTHDRQTMIIKNTASVEARAADLVSQLAKIDQVYIDLSKYVDTDIPFTYKPGSITNEITRAGHNLTPQDAYSLEKAMMIFNQIHSERIQELQSTNYNGEMGVSNGMWDTEADKEEAKKTALENFKSQIQNYYQSRMK